MAGRHHILLIGIDAYDGGGSLIGCVNDIDAIQRQLIDRAGVGPEMITRLVAPRTGATHETDVLGEVPTLDRMRAALVRLGTNVVSPEDHVFIYYSGHGTQCVVADKNGRRFSREALLPKDKVSGATRRFLFDWELNALLARIAERAGALTVVLDCCSSGGATRAVGDGNPGNERFYPSSGDYVLSPGKFEPGDIVRGLTTAVGRVKRCQLIAACRDDERARESADQGGRAHGELTRALLRQLNALSPSDLGDLRWGRIWRGVEAEVKRVNPRQSPWLAGSFGRRVFGLGPDEETDTGYAIEQSGSRFKLNVGSLAGVTDGAEVAVYGPTPLAFPPLGSTADLTARKGLLRVSRADRATSEAFAVSPFTLLAGARGRLAHAGPAARLRVAVVPDDTAISSLVAASPLVEIVSTTTDAELTLVRLTDGGWALTDDVHGAGELADEPVLAVIPPDRLAAARAAVEHYHAYVAPLRMARSCRDLPSFLRMWLLDCNGREVGPDTAQAPDLPQARAGIRAPYELTVGDRVCIVVENGSDFPLSVALVDSAASGRVAILGEKRIPAQSRHVFWDAENLGRPFYASLPAERSVGIDRIAAIATTRPDVSFQHLKRQTSFADILHPDRGATRHFGGADTGLPAEHWTSVLTTIRITRHYTSCDLSTCTLK